MPSHRPSAPGPDRGTAGRGWLLPTVLAVVALVSGAVLWSGAGVSEAPSPASAPGASSTESATSGEPASSAVAPSPRATALAGAGAPRRVVVESLEIDAPVVPIQLEGASLDPPDDPQVLGWWSGGAATGAERGTALVTGHTVNAGGGAMDDLEDVRAGAEIRVTTQQGTIRYRAESVQVLDKAALARQAQRLFSQDVAGRLVLVTCEDWDGTGYRSNVVVTAVPIS